MQGGGGKISNVVMDLKKLVKTCHRKKNSVKISPILHVYSDLVRQVKICLTTNPPFLEKKNHTLDYPPYPLVRKI